MFCRRPPPLFRTPTACAPRLREPLLSLRISCGRGVVGAVLRPCPWPSVFVYLYEDIRSCMAFYGVRARGFRPAVSAVHCTGVRPRYALRHLCIIHNSCGGEKNSGFMRCVRFVTRNALYVYTQRACFSHQSDRRVTTVRVRAGRIVYILHGACRRGGVVLRPLPRHSRLPFRFVLLCHTADKKSFYLG